MKKLLYEKNNILLKVFFLLFFSLNLYSDTITISLSGVNDDGEEQSSGTIYKNGNDLEMCYDNNNQQKIGLRFVNITIPKNSTITNAYIKFTSATTLSGTTSIVIYGENNSNPLDYAGANISSRNKTSSSVNWDNIISWNSDNTYNTPQLKDIVQQIVDRNDWESGKAMAFIIEPANSCTSPSCNRRVYSRDASSSTSAKLIIEFEPAPNPYLCPNPRNFEVSYKTNVRGDIELIGNSVMCKNNDGVCGDPGNARNNSINMMYVDGDNNASTFNSSAARLNLPANSEVLWATLYWQGYLSGGTNIQKENSAYIKYAYSSTKTGALSYTQQKADNHNWVYYNATRWYYQGSLNITNFVKSNKNGWYWVGDIITQIGKPIGGSYGAWSIAIVYKSNSKHLKNLTIYDGYVGIVTGGDNTTATTYATTNGCPSSGVANIMSIPLSGFITPSNGDVDSKFFVFAGEGDKNATGDYLKMKNKAGVDKNLKSASPSTINPENDIFNSTISKDGANLDGIDLYPFHSYNSNGIDIDTFRPNAIYPNEVIIGNDQTTTTVTLNTVGDGYHPGVFGFSTDLYEPRICYIQNLVKENNGTIYINDPITIDITIKNTKKEANDILEPATGVMVTTKIDNEYLSYQPNSFWIDDIDDSSFIHMTDMAGDDRAEFHTDENKSTYRVGHGATNSDGGRLEPEDNLKVKFTAIVKKSGDFNVSNEYLVTYTNGQIGQVFSNVPIETCVDFNTSLQVDKYGKFRVIEKKYENLSWNEAWIKDDLETKIAPFSQYEYCVLAGDSEEDNANPITENINVDINLYDFSTNDNGVMISNVIQNLEIIAENKACFTIPTNFYNRAAKKLAFKIYHPSDSNATEAKSDYFALRPDRYSIETNTTELFAGDKFLFTFKALDKNNNPLANYNENENDSNISFTKELNISTGCTTGNLVLEKILFNDGIANAKATYSEAGDLNVTLKEILGKEFARNDTNDTISSNRLITQLNKKVTFKPFKLSVNNVIYNGGFGTNPNWWLYSGTFPDYNITINSEIIAYSKDNNITTNFKSSCAAKDVNIYYDINSTNEPVNINYNISFIGDSNNSIANINSIKTVPSHIFTNGIGAISYSYGVDKNISNPINPFTIRANGLNITSTNLSKTIENADINQSTNIYYGRVVTRTLKTKNPTENAIIEIDVFSDTNNSLVNGFRQTYLKWYINELHENNNSGNILSQRTQEKDNDIIFTNNGIDSNGTFDFVITNNNPNISKNHNIELDINKWLWYSSTNNIYNYTTDIIGNCLNHPCFQYIFSANQNEEGVVSGIYEGSDINSSFKNNFNKKGVKTFR